MIKDPGNSGSDQEGFLYRPERPPLRPVVGSIPQGQDQPGREVELQLPRRSSWRSYNPAVRGHSGQIRKAWTCWLRPKAARFYSGGWRHFLAVLAAQLTELAREAGVSVDNTADGSLGALPGH